MLSENHIESGLEWLGEAGLEVLHSLDLSDNPIQSFRQIQKLVCVCEIETHFLGWFAENAKLTFARLLGNSHPKLSHICERVYPTTGQFRWDSRGYGVRSFGA